MLEEPVSIATEIVESWLKGGKALRYTLCAAIILVAIAILVLAYGQFVDLEKQFVEVVAGTFGVISAILTLGVIAYQRALERTKAERKIEAVEERFRENPKETQAAWELAQTKLESYLNRNLSQVRSIFWLTVLVMLFGFFLIGYGVLRAYDNPNILGPSILTACSGVIVNFIGATFLVVYKSTMTKVKEYMAIVERINAVGMSVQILENLKDSSADLKEKTTAELSNQLLELYGSSKRINK